MTFQLFQSQLTVFGVYNSLPPSTVRSRVSEYFSFFLEDFSSLFSIAACILMNYGDFNLYLDDLTNPHTVQSFTLLESATLKNMFPCLITLTIIFLILSLFILTLLSSPTSLFLLSLLLTIFYVISFYIFPTSSSSSQQLVFSLHQI
jgi:hypothetical protein